MNDSAQIAQQITDDLIEYKLLAVMNIFFSHSLTLLYFYFISRTFDSIVIGRGFPLLTMCVYSFYKDTDLSPIIISPSRAISRSPLLLLFAPICSMPKRYEVV